MLAENSLFVTYVSYPKCTYVDKVDPCFMVTSVNQPHCNLHTKR